MHPHSLKNNTVNRKIYIRESNGISNIVSQIKENTMAFRAKNSAEKSLRARYHDYNSQRRFRSQTTVSWTKYKEKTQSGRTKFAKGKSQ